MPGMNNRRRFVSPATADTLQDLEEALKQNPLD